jgi:hypothetical protein
MGNQIQNGETANNKKIPSTPIRSSSMIFSKMFSNDEKQKSRSSVKEGLYAEDKPFENFESI